MDYTFDASKLGKVGNTQQENTSINIKSNKENTNSTKSVSFENVYMSGLKIDRSKIDANTYTSLLKETDNVKEQIMASAESAQLSLKALFNRLSGMDAVRIDEDGFNLTNATPEEMVSIIDKIKIELAAYCEDYQITGTGVSLDKIKAVVGSASMAEDIAEKMSKSGVPLTDDNVTEVAEALEEIKGRSKISQGAKNYMVKHKLGPTIENISAAEAAAKAEAAGKKSNLAGKTEKLSDKEWASLKPQIEKMYVNSGIIPTSKDFDNARSFVEQGIPATTENLVYAHKLDGISLDMDKIIDNVIDNMVSGAGAKTASVEEGSNAVKEVAKAMNIIENADETQVAYATENAQNNNESVSLRSIEEACYHLRKMQDLDVARYMPANKGNVGNVFNSPEFADKADSNYRTLLEVQIMLTSKSGMFLARQGVSITGISISTLHKQLVAYERENVMEKIAAQLAQDIDSDAVRDTYNLSLETRKALHELKYAPDVTVGAVIKEEPEPHETMNIKAFANVGRSFRDRFKAAGETYQALGTFKRPDMGDSLDKALNASTKDILDNLGLEKTKANADAVRILGYNTMDMTKENIDKVKELHSTLNSLIKNMTPEVVLDMIRDHVNPMSDSISVVNQYLQNKHDELTETEEASNMSDIETQSEKYSTFLYKLDRTGGITDEERKQYIGIYKMMNMFTKDAGAAIGTLIKQNASITMENLCMAYNSRRLYGAEFTVNEEVEHNDNMSGETAYYMTLFDRTATSLTPLTLKSVQEDGEINKRSVENFCETANELFDVEKEAEYYEEYLNTVRSIADADKAVLRELERTQIPVTLNNIEACKQLMQPNAFTNLFGKMRGRVALFVEKTESREELEAEFRALKEESDAELEQAINGSGIVGEDNDAYEDINRLRLQNRQLGILDNLSRRHDYNVPFLTEDGVGVMKLTLVTNLTDDKKGSISVSFESDTMGLVSVEAKVSSDSVDIYGVCQKDDDELKEKINDIAAQLREKHDINRVAIYTNKIEWVRRVTYDWAPENVATDKLYKMSKTIISCLI